MNQNVQFMTHFSKVLALQSFLKSKLLTLLCQVYYIKNRTKKPPNQLRNGGKPINL